MRGWGCHGAHADELNIEPLAAAIQRGDSATAWLELEILTRDVPEWRPLLERIRSRPKHKETV